MAGLTLMPLQDMGAGFSLDAVKAEVERSKGYRIGTPIGAVAIETPVRRWKGQRFEEDAIEPICAFARERDIGLHLDGARIFIAAAYSGRDPADYARSFDTVYVSLYKYFNTPFGAVVAGPAALVDELRRGRMLFGGSLWQFWQAALIAGHFLENHLEDWRRAVAIGEAVIERVSANGVIKTERVSNGTNVFRLTLGAGDGEALDRFRSKAEEAGLDLPKAEDGILWARVNQTWLRREPEDIAEPLIAAAKAASSRR
jgi:threonine aldolase